VRALIMAMLFLGIPVSVFAHPVIDITFRQQYVFDAKGLTGFYQTWIFDETHSADILKMFDANHNGAVDPDELPALKKGYFDDLKDYSYFTSIVVDGKPVSTPDITSFRASFENNHMVYRFFVPLVVPAAGADHEVDVTIWDPTYYTDLSIENEDALTVQKPGSITATIAVANDHRHFYHLAPGVSLIKQPPFFLKMVAVQFHAAG
jgi:ABC-type uncharacterized transport system substrate-binding protein